MTKRKKILSDDGSPLRIRMDSPDVACFDPLALDLLGNLLRPDAPLTVAELLERANAIHPALACFTIPSFRPGFYTLDPRDIKKFGDEDDNFDYSEGEHGLDDTPPDFLWASVDSGALIFADFVHLPRLVSLLTWDEYDRSFADAAILPGIVERLGGPYFGVVISDDRLGMQFDGDGTYTIPTGSIKFVGD